MTKQTLIYTIAVISIVANASLSHAVVAKVKGADPLFAQAPVQSTAIYDETRACYQDYPHLQTVYHFTSSSPTRSNRQALRGFINREVSPKSEAHYRGCLKAIETNSKLTVNAEFAIGEIRRQLDIRERARGGAVAPIKPVSIDVVKHSKSPNYSYALPMVEKSVIPQSANAHVRSCYETFPHLTTIVNYEPAMLGNNYVIGAYLDREVTPKQETAYRACLKSLRETTKLDADAEFAMDRIGYLLREREIDRAGAARVDQILHQAPRVGKDIKVMQ